MVSKDKDSESKYVTILAQKIIKPLMINVLDEVIPDRSAPDSDENLDDKSFVSARGKEVKPLKCPNCDKTSYSSPGL